MANPQEKAPQNNSQHHVGKKNDSHRKHRKGGKQPQQGKTNTKVEESVQEVRPVKSEIPVIVPRVHEPNPLCSICGKNIESIAQSIGGPEPETFSHFDCVLRKIADDEKILPNQKVSYIGRGVFAVIELQSEGKFTIVKRINYENPETYAFMKKYVESRKK